MEKPIQPKHTEKRYRLLAAQAVFVLFVGVFAASLHAQTSAQNGFDEPILLVESVMCTVGEMLKFTVQIPHAEPADVRYTLPELSQRIQLSSAKKEAQMQFSGIFTIIELNFTFFEAGIIRLPDLVVTKKNASYTVVFPEITVNPDFAALQPSAFWQLDAERENEAKIPIAEFYTGKPLFLQISLQNVLEVKNFSVNSTDNALFEQKTPFPQARFVWTPLFSGDLAFPRAKLTILAMDGSEQVIYTDERFVRVSADSEKKSNKETNSANFAQNTTLERAFSGQNTTKTEIALSVPDDLKTAAAIAELRTRERAAFFPFAAAANRKKAEQEAGIVQGAGEPAVAWIIPLYTAAFFSALLVALVLMKKKRISMLFVTFTALFLCFAVIIHLDASKRYVIVQNPVVKTIPEHSAATAALIPAGTRVRVINSAGNWLCVEGGDRTGWLTCDSVIFLGSEKNRYIKNQGGDTL